MTDITDSGQRGPAVYDNWIAHKEGAHGESAYEVPLFTDAHIIGDATVGLGPYQFWNTVPMPDPQRPVKPSIVLRVEYLLHDTSPGFREMKKTDDKRYHGGGLQDEAAALVSLCLGIRVQAGGTTREFIQGRDPRGQPIAYESNLDPILPLGSHGEMIPQVRGDHNLSLLSSPFLALTQLSRKQAAALVQAARLYQDALWISRSEPELCWLMLVSALETASLCWRKAKDSPLERMRTNSPELATLLQNVGGETLFVQVAELIADYMGATRGFVDFVLKFLPPPPPTRPWPGAQFLWIEPNMQDALKIIYNYRSKALHGGIPFPAPMCMPPPPAGEHDEFAEIPLGVAARVYDATWLKKDMPLLLHTFEYITRRALLNWWQSLGQSEDTDAKAQASSEQ